MQIGNFNIQSKVLLAPMAGTSDKPFRKLAKQFGAGLATMEMVILEDNLLHTNKSKFRLNFDKEIRPISLQIAGTTTTQLTDYAKKAQNLGADIIDINFGCPAKKVCKKLAGSALLADEKLIAKILYNVIKNVDIPVTIKTRLGIDKDNINILNIAKIAEDSGVQMITIHGRTKAEKYHGKASYDEIKEVVKHVGIPVVANGDITDGIKAQQVLDFTGADAVMIGRATQGKPWIIKQINDYLNTGKWVEFEDKKHIVLNHIEDIYKFYPENIAISFAKKHIKWYLCNNNMPDKWQYLAKINNKQQQFNLLKKHFN